MIFPWFVVEPPSEKYEVVSWEDDIPNIWEIEFMFQTTNQISIADSIYILMNNQQ